MDSSVYFIPKSINNKVHILEMNLVGLYPQTVFWFRRHNFIRPNFYMKDKETPKVQKNKNKQKIIQNILRMKMW